MENITSHPDFDFDKTADYFSKRGWPVKFISSAELKLVPTNAGAALECADGRFDKFPNRKLYGPRIFGGINVIAAMITGGDASGFIKAARLVEGTGFTPGTHSAEHGGCGYYDLWAEGRVTSAMYPLDQSSLLNLHIKELMKAMSGKHFRLNGNHVEEAVRLNPYYKTTENCQDCKRFRVDDWYLAFLGVPADRRYNKIIETVEKLKSDAAKLEIIFV